jgi:hypothetical protein
VLEPVLVHVHLRLFVATIRSTTLGISVGTPLSVQPRRGVVNQDVFASIDWAIWAAKS